jgi:hypothetical protein
VPDAPRTPDAPRVPVAPAEPVSPAKPSARVVFVVDVLVVLATDFFGADFVVEEVAEIELNDLRVPVAVVDRVSVAVVPAAARVADFLVDALTGGWMYSRKRSSSVSYCSVNA